MLKCPNTASDNVVWLTYVRASAGQDSWQVAQFNFFRATWVAEACKARNAAFALLPAEVQNSPEEFSNYPDESTCGEAVIVRADMPATPTANSMAVARKSVDAILAISGGQELSAWSFFSARHFIGSDLVRSAGTRPQFLRELDAWEHNSAWYTMARMGPSLFGNHFEATPELAKTLDLSVNLNKLDSAQSSKNPALTVQMLEHLSMLTRTTSAWWKFTENSFTTGWIWSELIQDLVDHIRQATEGHETYNWLRPDVDSAALETLLATIPAQGTHVSDLHVFADSGVSLLKLLDQGWLPARLLNRACHIVSDSESRRHKARKRYAGEFSTRLARLKRYRNNTIHGTSIDTVGAESVLEFSQKLARTVANIHVNSVTRGEDTANLISQHVDTSTNKLIDTDNDRLPAKLW